MLKKLVGSKMRRALVPLFATPQDKRMLALARGSSTEQMTIVHHFSGEGMSYVATRCTERSRFIPFYPRLIYCDLSAIPLNEVVAKVEASVSPLQVVLLFARKVVALVLAAGVLVLLKNATGREQKRGDEQEESTVELLQRAISESSHDLPLLVLGALLVTAIFRRRPIFILDNALTAECSHGDAEAARVALDRIRAVFKTRAALFMTTNDGIEACFEDTAPGMHLSEQFVSIDAQDLLSVLHDSGSSQ